MKSSFKVIDLRIDVLDIFAVTQDIEGWIKREQFGNYICITNMNDVAKSAKSEEVKEATNAAMLSVPDGMSLVLLARLKGFDLKKRVYGPDLMDEFLKLSQVKGYSHFFYGGSQTTLEKLESNLKQRFPGLKIAGFYSPPFRQLSQEEDKEIIEKINQSFPDVLWVGLGCPKQQLWMYKHRDKLKVPAIVGVGAAFDFFAKTKLQAPSWVRNSGFEWLFRLIIEPRRLWKRYLVSNSVFLWLLLKEFVNIRIFRKNS